MIDFIKTKNFTFECEFSAYGDSIDITVDVCLCGKANRFYLDTVKAMNVGKAINKFLDDWFQTAMPTPCANYIGIAKLVNYNPAAAIAHGCQLGKQQTTKLFIEEMVKGNQVIPPYSTITSDRDEAAILHSALKSRDEWANRIMDEACVKAMAGEHQHTKIKHPLFGDEPIDMVWQQLEANAAISETLNKMHEDAMKNGTGYLVTSKDGIRRVDFSEVTKEPKK